LQPHGTGTCTQNARRALFPHNVVRPDTVSKLETLRRELAIAETKLAQLRTQQAAAGSVGAAAATSPAALATAAEIGAAVEEVCTKEGLSNVGTHRHVNDEGIPPDDAPTDYLGPWFKFENREEQCKLVVGAFAAMDLQRGSHRMDAKKRDLRVPVCTGMPGIGKTRFVRAAVVHLARTATGLPSPTCEEVLAAIPAMASTVWPSDEAESRIHHDLLQQLVIACFEHRNLCVALNSATLTTDSLERSLAVELLAQWAKYRPRTAAGAAAPLVGEDAVVNQLAFELCRALAVRRVVPTVAAALEYIVGTSSGPLAGDAARSSDHVPAVIINIDEAHNRRELLPAVVELLVQPLIVRNIRVFVTITGMTSDHITAAINESSVKPFEIVLPLLKQHNMVNIVATLFGVHPDQVPPSVATAAWWTGGVPRFLEYLLRHCGIKARAPKGLRAVWAWLAHATMDDVTDAIRMTSRVLPEAAALPSDLLDNMFSLTLAERPVPITCVLTTTGNPVWTVQYAQSNQLLYWEGHRGGNGIVRLPPLVLHLVHQRSAAGASASLLPLKMPSAHMTETSNGNEALAVSALLHKLHAAQIANSDTVWLSELLGEGQVAGMEDLQLTVPGNLSLRVLQHKVEKHNFQELARITREGLREQPKTTDCAFLNGRGASFADAFIIFPDFVVFVQEKQCVLAHQKRALGRAVPPVPEAEVEAQYDKVRMIGEPHVYLYVSDCRARDGYVPPPNTLVFTHDTHDKLFGSTMARLRAAATEENAV
jgi:hypothetical protein